MNHDHRRDQVLQNAATCKEPGAEWHPMEYYLAHHGNRIETEKGHYEGFYQKRNSVWIPDTP
eukprot:3217009-Karenia_brevis.AAC.1